MRELDLFGRDIKKYQDQSGDEVTDMIKHGVLAGGVRNPKVRDHINLNVGKLTSYESLRNEVFACARATCIWVDDSAMDVSAISKGAKGGKGKGKDKKGGKEATGTGKGSSASKGDETCFYCGKPNHRKAECRKLEADIAAGRVDAKGKAIATDGNAQQGHKSSGTRHPVFAITLFETTPQVGVSFVGAGLGSGDSQAAGSHNGHWFIAPVTVEEADDDAAYRATLSTCQLCPAHESACGLRSR